MQLFSCLSNFGDEKGDVNKLYIQSPLKNNINIIGNERKGKSRMEIIGIYYNIV